MVRRVRATAPFAVLGSRLDDDAGRLHALSASVRARAARLSAAERERCERHLWPDLFSEYDARFLSAWVRGLDHDFTAGFRACEARWARDEELHFLGFRAVYAALTGADEAELDARLARRAADVDFAPLAHLFADELTAACLMAYDELATVRAYQRNGPVYALLGPELERFVAQVTADEGRHFRNFLKLLRIEHADRLDEVPAAVAAIRATEGTPYANTFVLDHDDDVWDDALFDEAADVLRRRLAPVRPSGAVPAPSS